MTSFSASSGQSQQFGSFHMGSHHDPKRMLPPAARDQRDSKIKITMENRELWQKFHSLGTEMIITKSGRWVHVYLILRGGAVLHVIRVYISVRTLWFVFMSLIAADLGSISVVLVRVHVCAGWLGGGWCVENCTQNIHLKMVNPIT